MKNKCRDIFANESGLLIYDASPADINRMKCIYNIAKEFGRTLIFDSKKAFILLYLNYPSVMCPGIPSKGEFKIFLGRQKIHASRYKKFKLPQDIFAETYCDYRRGHEAKLLISQSGKQEDKKDLICLPDEMFIWGPLRDEVLKNPDKYVLYTSSGAHTLLHFFPPDGGKIPGKYIYGKAEPFKEEMELSFKRLVNWVNLCGLEIDYAHTSGHMYSNDVERVIAEINPKLVIPIHTEHSGAFSQWAPNLQIAHLGEEIELS